MTVRSATRSWTGVALIGVAVIGLVLGLRLFPRLNAGQEVVDTLKPSFAKERVIGDRASLAMMARIIDIGYPVLSDKGMASEEVGPLVTFMAEQLGVPRDDVIASLKSDYPHLNALLASLPLSEVTKEFPNLLKFLGQVLELTPEEVLSALQKNFPRLAQALDQLMIVVPGRDYIPGTEDMFTFAGAKVTDTPQMRDYLTNDVLPVFENHQRDFQRLTWFPPVRSVPYILTLIGLLLLALGILMALRSHRGQLRDRTARHCWIGTAGVGVTVLVAVFGFALYPRLNGGADLLSSARPAMTEAQVTGTRAGVDMAASIINTLDPVMTPKGGAEKEVPALVAFVAKESGLSQKKVLATLQSQFPHTAALLQAIPFTKVTAEFNDLVASTAKAKAIEPGDVIEALNTQFPHLMRASLGVAYVSTNWYAVPGLDKMTRFDGTPVRSVTEMRDYLSADLVASVEQAAPKFRRLDSISPRLDVFPPLLTALGVLIIGYSGLHLRRFRRATGSGDQ